MTENNNIEILEQVKELKEPFWEKQEGESTESYQKFFLYYLQQQGNKSIKNAVLAWCKANNIQDELLIEQEIKHWQIIADRNLWDEREEAYEIAKFEGAMATNMVTLELFMQEANKIAQQGMMDAQKGLAISGKLQEEYIKDLTHKGVITKDGGIDFDNFDEVKYASLTKSFKTSAETTKIMMEICADALGLQELISQMNENRDLTE